MSTENYNRHYAETSITLRQVANLFNKVILCVQKLATMFVQVYANPFIGERVIHTRVIHKAPGLAL